MQSATWQAQGGRLGEVLANVADLPETPRIELPGQGVHTVTINLDGQVTKRQLALPATINLAMHPRALALIETEPQP